MLLHGRSKLVVDEGEKPIHIRRADAEPFKHGHSHFRSEVSRAAGHAHEPAVDDFRTLSVGGHGIGDRQAEVVVPVEATGMDTRRTIRDT